MSQVEDLVDAIDAFIVGCKDDGIWDAIKACCIMAAWDGLTPALLPLKGPQPDNNNFVSGDYNRKTGLVGDGATKYLDSNRANNADPQNSQHLSAFVSTFGTSIIIGLNGSSVTGASLIANDVSRSRNAANAPSVAANAQGFCGISRASSSNFTQRVSETSTLISQSSQTPSVVNLELLRLNNTTYGTHRISFYSIGEALDLALLDSRVSTLMTAIGAAIP